MSRSGGAPNRRTYSRLNWGTGFHSRLEMQQSDLHTVRNEWSSIMPTTYPCVTGHEIVGRVSKVGSAFTKFKPGNIVGVGCLVDSDQTCPIARLTSSSSAAMRRSPTTLPTGISVGSPTGRAEPSLIPPFNLNPKGSFLRGGQGHGPEIGLVTHEKRKRNKLLARSKFSD